MQRFQNILFFVHANRSSDRAVARVRWLAEHTGADVTVFGIDPLSGTQLRGLTSFLYPSEERSAPMGVSCQETLELITQTLSDHGINARAVIGHGPEVQEILQQIQIGNHDLCVKPMDHAHIGGLWPSTDLQLLRECPVALWLLHPNQTGRVQRLLAAVDLDDDQTESVLTTQVLDMATSLAELDGALLDVLHAWWLPEESGLRHGFLRQPKEEVDALVSEARQQARRQLNQLIGQYASPRIDLHAVLQSGLPKDVIPNYAREQGADTLIMGTEGRTGFANLLVGNTAEAVLKQLDCSLLIVRPPSHGPEDVVGITQ